MKEAVYQNGRREEEEAGKTKGEKDGNTEENRDEETVIDFNSEEKLAAKKYGKSLRRASSTTGIIYKGLAIDFWNAVEKLCLNGVKFYYRELIHRDCVNSSGESPLHIVCRKGHLDIISFLLSSGFNVNIIANNSTRNTPLIEAAHNGYYSLVKLLIDSTADLDYQNAYGDTALHNAIYENHENVVELLINSGANDKLKNKNGNTANYIYEEKYQVDQ